VEEEVVVVVVVVVGLPGLRPGAAGGKKRGVSVALSFPFEKRKTSLGEEVVNGGNGKGWGII
jgi:hypothetical protein